MIWKQLPAPASALYCVSDQGDVCRFGSSKFLRPSAQKRGGYLAVSLWESNKGKTWPVHQLVAMAFHGPRPSERHHAAHLDGNKLNNSADNIRWVTKEENESHKREHGTANIGTRNGSAKLTPATIIAARVAHQHGEKPASIGRRLGIEQSHLSRILNHRLWKELEHDDHTGS